MIAERLLLSVTFLAIIFHVGLPGKQRTLSSPEDWMLRYTVLLATAALVKMAARVQTMAPPTRVSATSAGVAKTVKSLVTPAWMAVVRVKTTHARTTELALKTAPGATTASVIPTMRDRTVSRVAGCDRGVCYCNNNGACIDNYEECHCNCDTCHTAEHCDSFANPDPCPSEPCQNNGTCTQTCDGYSCQCAVNYAGTVCDEPCLLVVTKNNSAVVELRGNHTFHVDVIEYGCGQDTHVNWAGPQGTEVGTEQDLDLTYVKMADSGLYKCTATETQYAKCTQELDFHLSVYTNWDTGSCQDSQGSPVYVTVVESGSQLTLSCVMPSRPNVGLDWVRNNVTVQSTNVTVEVNGVTYKNITISDLNVTQEDVGLYRCVASNLDATHDVCSVDVSLACDVMSVVQTTSAVVQLGSNHTFSVQTRGEIIYSWSNPQGRVVANTSTLTLTNIKMADAGTYTCTGVDSCTQQINFTLAVNTEWDTGECYNSETRDTTPTKLDVGGSFILSCVVPRQPTPELNWFLDNVAVTSGLLLVDRTDLNYTTLELSADDVTKEDAGRYSCVASYLDAIVTVCDVEVTVAGSKTNGTDLPDKGMSIWVPVAIGAGGGLGILAIAACCCLMYLAIMRKKKRKEKKKNKVEPFVEDEEETAYY
ncbi:hypothetical protein NP493_321g03011 [Ridgeia piscesae]|uniref:Uncharacterized protein n=1 Tax=Ridgeia piscesae TaxID=27915 RepID=A0AAD9L4N7_RIDPI|nr:hypothetical protein NP493_321g03011 [Ridgeia piscesae]